MKYFTHYWRGDTWEQYRGRAIDYTAGNILRSRGIKPGDRLYIVTNIEGAMHVGGYVDVAEVIGRARAAKIVGREVWDATDFAIAQSPQPFHPELRVPNDVVRNLRMGPQQKPPIFRGARLDQQSLRGLRELTPDSAALLDDVLKQGGGSSRRVEKGRRIRQTDKPFDYVALREALGNAWRSSTEVERKFLLAHYGLPDRTGSANEIAQSAGYPDYHSSNAHYGPFGRRVAEQLGYEPRDWLNTIVTPLDQNSEGHRRLRLDDGVVRAMQELGIVDGNGAELEQGIPDGITRDDILKAISSFEAGESHGFGESTKYDLLFRGRRYPPKAIIGLAAERIAGRILRPGDFSGGIDSKCFRVLRNSGFDVIPKRSDLPEDLEDDLAEEELQQRTDIGPTVKETLVQARRGQGVYKKNLERLEKSCRITGITDRQHLIASHIKPWRHADDQEKLDGNNGLLLSPHIDHLFDRGYISFADDGTLLVSRRLNPALLDKWALRVPFNAGAFNAAQRRYMAYHRERVFENKQRRSSDDAADTES